MDAFARAVSPRLARQGLDVRRKLRRHERIQTFPVEGFELHFFQQFLSAEECAALMGLIDETAKPSSLYKGTEIPGFRTSYSGNLDRQHPLIRAVDTRICTLMGLDKRHGETIQGQRYSKGQEFKPHHDFFHTNQAYWETEKPHGGQRSWTAMAYLNVPDAGGATRFPKFDLDVEPRAGMLVLWNNIGADGAPNPLSLHAGCPVTAGTKYVVTKWFRERFWR